MMRPIVLLLTLLCLGGTALATPQACDRLVYNRVTRAMCSTPLEYYYHDQSQRPLFQFRPEMPILSVNWRGYIATWELQDNLLYLVDIQGVICKHEHGIQKDCKKAELKDLFGDKCVGGRVFAAWFSGELEIPDGKVLYKATDAPAIYERNILLQIESGKMIKTTVVKNRKKHRFF